MGKSSSLGTFAVLILLMAGGCGRDYDDWRGDEVARRDVQEGRYAILNAGLPPQFMFEFQRLLQERYQVEVRFTGCLVSDEILAFQAAYNKVSVAAIEEKFGKDVIAKTREEAERTERAKLKTGL